MKLRVSAAKVSELEMFFDLNRSALNVLFTRQATYNIRLANLIVEAQFILYPCLNYKRYKRFHFLDFWCVLERRVERRRRLTKICPSILILESKQCIYFIDQVGNLTASPKQLETGKNTLLKSVYNARTHGRSWSQDSK